MLDVTFASALRGHTLLQTSASAPGLNEKVVKLPRANSATEKLTEPPAVDSAHNLATDADDTWEAVRRQIKAVDLRRVDVWKAKPTANAPKPHAGQLECDACHKRGRLLSRADLQEV